jgi:hypothetical protein
MNDPSPVSAAMTIPTLTHRFLSVLKKNSGAAWIERIPNTLERSLIV